MDLRNFSNMHEQICGNYKQNKCVSTSKLATKKNASAKRNQSSLTMSCTYKFAEFVNCICPPANLRLKRTHPPKAIINSIIIKKTQMEMRRTYTCKFAEFGKEQPANLRKRNVPQCTGFAEILELCEIHKVSADSQ